MKTAMKMLGQLTAKQREEAILVASMADFDVGTVQLKSNGQPITDQVRDDLLAKCAKNEYVELTLDVLAYEQFADKPNRNFVRVKDSAMSAFAKTGVGRPFLRDHQQNNSLAVCGSIVDSNCVDLGGGHFQINQSVKLTAPWAVDLALRGLMTTVSISWRATGAVKCSACDAQVFSKCWHCPGDKLSTYVDDFGVKRFKYDRAGQLTVQWIYDSVEQLELSPVPVPAGPTAKIGRVKAALNLDPDVDLDADLSHDPAPTHQENAMTDAEIAALTAKLARAEKIAALNDAEKSYFKRLGAHEQDSFLAMGPMDRSKELQPVYTSTLTGSTFDKSHDQQIIEMAKAMDKQSAALSEQLKTATNAALTARAETELGHMAGTVEERAALLGAVETIADPAVRTACLAMIKETDVKASANFQRQGAGTAKKPVKGAGDAQAELDALVQAEMAKDDSDEIEALSVVMATDKGVELYNKIESAKQAERANRAAGLAGN